MNTHKKLIEDKVAEYSQYMKEYTIVSEPEDYIFLGLWAMQFNFFLQLKIF